MADDLNPAIIKRTQDSLGKYIKKPSLTEKLLKKPPFGFLHDVFRIIIRDTGCFVGLYTPDELKYENIKDRNDKMKFLQKMIDVINLITNSNLGVRASKIVAGYEPEKTNELLQLMGEVIDKKLDWQPAVEQVLMGKTEPKESSRKTKYISNKVSKDTKTKVKSKEKEKETKIKDTKLSKTSNKSSVANTYKDDKDKSKKIKEKLTTKVNTKDKTSSKVSEGPEKFTRKSTKETSIIKMNDKTSPAPIIEKSRAKNDSLTNENECNHEKMVQQMDNIKVPTSYRKSSIQSINNELMNSNENDINRQDTLTSNNDKSERLSAEKSTKSSVKSEKPSTYKVTEGLDEKRQDKENTNSLEISDNSIVAIQEKSGISATKPKEETNVIQKQEEPKELPIIEPNNQSESPPSPTLGITNEMKRENTFTRESSKEESSSNKSSSVNRPRTFLRPPSARPPSARPGAPRRRDKNIEIILQPNDQIKMSGIQVKLETFGDLDDDGDNLVIIDNLNANDVTSEQLSNLTENEKLLQDETIEQGHLVQQILETQKELVQKDDNGQQKIYKNSTNNLVMRQTSGHLMNNLRDVIQNLTKSINPLGKLMDFIPEDIDAMQLEFTMWRDTYTQAANELKREKSLTESATEPMKNQLIEIEANIAEYREMIDVSRVKILQNSEKILKMLTT